MQLITSHDKKDCDGETNAFFCRCFTDTAYGFRCIITAVLVKTTQLCGHINHALQEGEGSQTFHHTSVLLKYLGETLIETLNLH